MAAFVRDTCYVAACAREFGRELLVRTLLGEPVLLEAPRVAAPFVAFSPEALAGCGAGAVGSTTGPR
ncbi:hypothetical protein [Streptomyces sp. NPDC060035]|uniref:hypothetical protein n=1 Tax=Streptomyces sp. NPDC060035 TaxID=3347044 RepID=UPI0036CFB3DA